MPYKIIFFDLDGTLVDSRKDLANAINIMRQQYLLPELPLETIVSYIGDGIGKLIERSMNGEVYEMNEARDKMLDFYFANIAIETSIYPGVRETFSLLKQQDCKVVVLTNKQQDAAERLLAELGLAEDIDIILGPENAGGLKPDPIGIVTTLKKLEFTPADALIVGDHHTDLKAGVAAGIATCFVTYGLGNTGGVEPTFTIDKLSDITQLQPIAASL